MFVGWLAEKLEISCKSVHGTAVFEDLACVRQKRKFWSRVNYQETFAHTRILFGHVRARVVYTMSRDFRCSLFHARSSKNGLLLKAGTRLRRDIPSRY